MVRIKKYSFFLLILVLFGYNSCSNKSEYIAYQDTSKEGMQPTPYIFEVKDSLFQKQPRNLFIHLRNDNSYAFTNIFLICTLKAGNELVISDTLEYAMAAPDGRWLGSGFTEVKESKLWWKEGVVVSNEDPVTIEITQAMRNSGEPMGISNLKGIVSVGISIEAQD
jgi:gliding motility-associated lipoprotein GldH